MFIFVCKSNENLIMLFYFTKLIYINVIYQKVMS